jgi:hypothetical protein
VIFKRRALSLSNFPTEHFDQPLRTSYDESAKILSVRRCVGHLNHSACRHLFGQVCRLQRSTLFYQTAQKQSGGKKEQDDLFRLMESRFGLTGTEYTPEDLQRAASEVAGINLADFSAQRARYSYQRQTSAPSNSSLTHHFGRRCAILSIDARQILVAGAFHTTGAFSRQIRF